MIYDVIYSLLVLTEKLDSFKKLLKGFIIRYNVFSKLYLLKPVVCLITAMNTALNTRVRRN